MIYRFDGREPVVGQGTYVSELATVIGDVVIGAQCYIDLAAQYLARGMQRVL